MKKYFWLIFAVTGFIFSCSDSELLTPGDEFQQPDLPGTFTVEIDGVLTDFSTTTSVNSNDASTQINGANEEGQNISISIPNPVAEGTYTQGDNVIISVISGGTGAFMNISTTGQLLPISVKITGLDMFNMTVSGTFSATVYNSADDVNVELTNGKFVELPLTISDGGDAIFKGTFGVDDNQTDLDFSTNAHASGMSNNALISGENVNQIQTMSISVPGGIEAGMTYTDLDEVLVQVNLGTSDNPSDVYTNYDSANDIYLPVSITIDEITQDVEGRVTGSFTGTIQKFGSGTQEQIEITNGIIDVPIETP